MVFASMYGSSASNEYGKGGTENATGCSSKLRLGSEDLGVSAQGADAFLRLARRLYARCLLRRYGRSRTHVLLDAREGPLGMFGDHGLRRGCQPFKEGENLP